MRSRWPPAYALGMPAPGSTRRMPGGASGLSCGVVSPKIPARAGGPLRRAQSGPCYPTKASGMQPVAPGLSRGMPPLQAVPDEHLGYPPV